jgi:hypothetical protein
MLEASAQNAKSVKTRVFPGGPTCESAKTKVTICGGRSGKVIRDGGKSSVPLVEIDTFLSSQEQNTNPTNLPFN